MLSTAHLGTHCASLALSIMSRELDIATAHSLHFDVGQADGRDTAGCAGYLYKVLWPACCVHCKDTVTGCTANNELLCCCERVFDSNGAGTTRNPVLTLALSHWLMSHWLAWQVSPKDRF